MLMARVTVLCRCGNQVEGSISLRGALQNGWRMPPGCRPVSVGVSAVQGTTVISLWFACVWNLWAYFSIIPTNWEICSKHWYRYVDISIYLYTVTLTTNAKMDTKPWQRPPPPPDTPCPTPPPRHGCGTWWPRSVRVCTPTPASAGPPSDCRRRRGGGRRGTQEDHIWWVKQERRGRGNGGELKRCAYKRSPLQLEQVTYMISHFLTSWQCFN